MGLQVSWAMRLWACGPVGLWACWPMSIWSAGLLGLWTSRSIGPWLYGRKGDTCAYKKMVIRTSIWPYSRMAVWPYVHMAVWAVAQPHLCPGFVDRPLASLGHIVQRLDNLTCASWFRMLKGVDNESMYVLFGYIT